MTVLSFPMIWKMVTASYLKLVLDSIFPMTSLPLDVAIIMKKVSKYIKLLKILLVSLYSKKVDFRSKLKPK